ncbi:ligase-associated DNA damage response endonuclease PdeM [Palleronia sediminis]|uniref:Ligase-associated DNA damage response endonuclease PdeM n=1 Tax=Palleronia sediminis TaxID=2547833 RepID=A0A4R5ZYN7_9RHOB|nr:ligase-associated DNA damage response endonuclease PdeM [Palleronia sediminis]TDL76330.1 ligase-associated DNA damage response endonuclease PdeM [Palleronia sediminis]
MNALDFDFAGERLTARGTGALWWAARRCLVVADLHLGKAERFARKGRAQLPPYEIADTLARLLGEIKELGPEIVVALGDSFDDDAARDALSAAERAELADLVGGRRWVWIAGNHDPGGSDPGGETVESCEETVESCELGRIVFRHIATPCGVGEVSGHYHPKLGLGLGGKRVSRRCFVTNGARLILPAFGTFTGGLDCTAPPIRAVMGDQARAILTGPHPCMVPVPRLARA